MIITQTHYFLILYIDTLHEHHYHTQKAVRGTRPRRGATT